MRLSRVRNSILAAKIDRVESDKLELQMIYLHLMTRYHFLRITTFNSEERKFSYVNFNE